MTRLEQDAACVTALFGALDASLGDHRIGMALDRPRRFCDCAECEAMRERDAIPPEEELRGN